MIQRLRERGAQLADRKSEAVREERAENYLVPSLGRYSEIDYDSQSELLFKAVRADGRAACGATARRG